MKALLEFGEGLKCSEAFGAIPDISPHIGLSEVHWRLMDKCDKLVVHTAGPQWSIVVQGHGSDLWRPLLDMEVYLSGQKRASRLDGRKQ